MVESHEAAPMRFFKLPISPTIAPQLLFTIFVFKIKMFETKFTLQNRLPNGIHAKKVEKRTELPARIQWRPLR